MYKVTAKVVHAFSVPASEKYEESFKVQLMGDNILKDGQVKLELLTLTVPEDVFEKLKDKSGTVVSLPIAFFVRGNQLTPFYPRQGVQAAA